MRTAPILLLIVALISIPGTTVTAKIDKADAFQRLASDDPEVRAGIHQELAREGKAALKLVKQYLGDSKRPYRDEVVAVLGMTQEEKALPLLRSAMSDKDPAVQAAAARALGVVPGRFVVKTILKELPGAKGEMQRELVLSLGRVGTQESADELARMAEDPSNGCRLHAVEALGFLPEDLALAGLATSVRDDDAAVRQNAVRAIMKLESRTFVSDLVRLLEDPDPQAADLAAQALGQMGEQGEEALIGAVRGLDGPVRITAARQLAELGSERAPKELAIALGEVDTELRIVILQVLAELKAEDQVHLILASASDSDPRIRKEALSSLIAIQGVDAASLVSGALNDPDPEIQAMAMEQLVHLQGGQSAVLIAPLMICDDADLAALAERTMIEMGGDAVPELVQCTGAADPILRLKAVELLGRSGDPRAVEPLLRQLRSVDTRYRDAAVLALTNLAPAEAVEPLNKLLKRRITSEVRRNVEAALAAIAAKR